MPGINPSADHYLIHKIKELESRLFALETQPALNNAAVSGGQLTIQDANYKPVVVLGREADNSYGLWTVDASGNVIARLGQITGSAIGLEITNAAGTWDLARFTSVNGWEAPHIAAAPSYDPNAFKAITSPTFVDTWAVMFGDALGAGIELCVTWATDAATTGDIRITSNLPGTSATLSVAAGTNGRNYCRWLHGVPVGTGPVEFRVQARRTAGAGNVDIFPAVAWVRDVASCSAGGTWV